MTRARTYPWKKPSGWGTRKHPTGSNGATRAQLGLTPDDLGRLGRVRGALGLPSDAAALRECLRAAVRAPAVKAALALSCRSRRGAPAAGQERERPRLWSVWLTRLDRRNLRRVMRDCRFLNQAEAARYAIRRHPEGRP